jgi:hypothetical protein
MKQQSPPGLDTLMSSSKDVFSETQSLRLFLEWELLQELCRRVLKATVDTGLLEPDQRYGRVITGMLRFHLLSLS